MDADCDDADGEGGSLGDLDVIIDGGSGEQELVGWRIDVCDIDADGHEDVVVAAPLANGYAGQIGIFYGANHASWSSSMDFADADTIIDSSAYFFGGDAQCADIDGDGNLDLVSSRLEYSTGGAEYSDFGVLIFYGDGDAFAPSLTDSADGIELSFDIGVPDDYLTYAPMTLGDLDGDGASELILTMYQGSSANTQGDIWVIPGDYYTRSAALDTLVSAVLTTDEPDSAGTVRVVSDLDGDGHDELFVGEPGIDADTDTGTAEGMVSFVGDPANGAIAGQAFGSLVGDGNWLYGYDVLIADFDGDAVTDGAISAPYEATGGAESGAILFHSAFAADLSGARIEASGLVDGRIYGTDGHAFGYKLHTVGDVDGDGTVDILTLDTGPGNATDGFTRNFWLVRGGISGDDVRADDAALMTWTSELQADGSGDGGWGVGDIDGDGLEDWVLGAYTYPPEYGTGRVYIELSTSWGD